MRTENAILMKMARESLKGKWGLAIGVSVVYFLLVAGVQMIPRVGWIGSVLITGPMILGLAVFFLALSRNQDAKLEQMFEGFNNFGNSLAAYLLISIFVFLWALLLIVPGIIAALSYAMVFYIMADDKSIGATEAIERSKKMMDGYKWKLFCLKFRFLGWALLCVLTFGIGFLWLAPYVDTSMAKFYDDIKDGQTAAENAPEQATA
ncbi:MAG: DUF975 family protein [Candidatus Moranbacteria bacterium]|nr:DUF975 family protein [Candidatus Moranbacteria bacterium]MDZ4385125.1 DUF975 family protein [Candidatus Moranbacteria bacterium]